jgi:hypothetical protein
VVVESALGVTVVWKPVEWRYGRVVPLPVATIADYQKLGSSVTHKVVFEKGITLNLADYRFKHLDKTYEPAQPPIVLDNNTSIVVSEV